MPLQFSNCPFECPPLNSKGARKGLFQVKWPFLIGTVYWQINLPTHFRGKKDTQYLQINSTLMADKLDYKGIFNFYKKQTQVEKKSFFFIDGIYQISQVFHYISKFNPKYFFSKKETSLHIMKIIHKFNYAQNVFCYSLNKFFRQLSSNCNQIVSLYLSLS